MTPSYSQDERLIDKDHYPDCESLPESVVLALQVDRNVRSDVRKYGKRLRDAFREMLGNVAKRFKTSEKFNEER